MPYVSLQSLNFPDRSIRHQNFLGEISQIQSDLDRHDATFQIRDGAGLGDLVMLRSLNFPLHVLRHQDFRVKLHEYNPPIFAPPNRDWANVRRRRRSVCCAKTQAFSWYPASQTSLASRFAH
jgi:hypothetical protein